MFTALCYVAGKQQCTTSPLSGILKCPYSAFHKTLNRPFFYSYLVEGNSDGNCVVKMTKFYFEKLGPHYTGSVVLLCAPQNPHIPGPKSLAYSGAIQVLQYVLGLIGEDPQGEIIIHGLPLKLLLD